MIQRNNLLSLMMHLEAAHLLAYSAFVFPPSLVIVRADEIDTVISYLIKLPVKLQGRL